MNEWRVKVDILTPHVCGIHVIKLLPEEAECGCGAKRASVGITAASLA